MSFARLGRWLSHTPGPSRLDLYPTDWDTLAETLGWIESRVIRLGLVKQHLSK